MIRKLALFAVLASAAYGLDLRTGSAAPVSARNPYRSFNLSGVNYGSMQWEHQHRGRSSRAASYHGRGFLFRRR